MASILFFSIRISPKNTISIIRRFSIQNEKTVLNVFHIPLSYSRSNIFNSTTNNINHSALSLLKVHSRWFRTSTLLQKEIDVNIPEFPEAISEGDVKWRKKVGDRVVTDEIVCEVETDKTSIEVNSPCNGVIIAQYADEGTPVKSKQKIFRVQAEESGAAKVAHPPRTVVPQQPPADKPKPPIIKPAPPVKQPAPPVIQPPPPMKQSPPPIQQPAPTIKQPTPPVKQPTPPTKQPVQKPQDPTKEIKGSRSEHRVNMSKIRQQIGRRLKQAQNENAMLTTFNEIDMTNLIAFRKEHQEAFSKKHGIKLGFMSTFVKACAYALHDQPIVNACIEGNEIVYRDYVDISVAVATPKGLVVPVLRNVSEMNYADIEKNINLLGEKARKGKLSIDDMNGGTFTISNGGVFGSLMGTPIINPPQSAILGMHATFERPVAVKGQIVIKPMMYVALTYDHRLIDGREAVLFLRKIKSGVENPVVMIAGM